MNSNGRILERLGQSEYAHKFNEDGPYYTSYPTLGLWTEDFGPEQYECALESFLKGEGSEAPIALYVHIPFCAKLCYYCICNLKITNNESVMQKFVDNLCREIEMLLAFFTKLGTQPNICEVHLGGGTPSHLSNDQFGQLIDKLGLLFDVDAVDELAMEIDPRTTTQEDLMFFSQQGVDRISFGVQDFDAGVQEAINRVQPVEMVESLLSPDIRSLFTSVNFDLLYGLPLQTRETFRNTVELTCRLRPERVTLLKYAHVPDVRKHMNLIKEDDLPREDDYPRIFGETVEHFLEHGYDWIGIDNFASTLDVLAEAVRNRTLGRDFNGWHSGRAKHLIGLGPSSTGAFGSFYCQSRQDLPAYYQSIDEGQFPVFRGCTLTRDDTIRRDMIFRILCHQCVDFREFENQHGVVPEDYFAEELKTLSNGNFDEAMLVVSDRVLSITHWGRFFSRQICRVFDLNWRNKKYRIVGP